MLNATVRGECQLHANDVLAPTKTVEDSAVADEPVQLFGRESDAGYGHCSPAHRCEVSLFVCEAATQPSNSVGVGEAVLLPVVVRAEDRSLPPHSKQGIRM